MKCSSIWAESGAAAGRPNPPRELRRVHPSRELEQRQRIPVRLGDDALEHPVIHPSWKHGLQKGPRVATSREVRRMHLGEPAERFAALAGREEQRDPVRQQPPGDERERPSRGTIEPLGVVDHTQRG
jgi:hypothetical protein